jgi:hypothetical protein
MNITESNKLIAEFMGVLGGNPYEYPQFERLVDTGSGYGWSDLYNHTQLKYHTSWDWLMPVVEKIEGMGFYVRIAGEDCTISKNSKFSAITTFSGMKKEATYKAVVEFIKWCNENK